uniref:LysM and putative peptidoglycan-binding domain-containing protein 2 n=3 Tax=Culex pipiens TaxID=7175 RepID=A0A8D8FXU4_CULPI
MSLDTMNDLVQKYKNWKSYIKFVKLVSDGGTTTGATAMEDETIFGEKQSIRDSARTLKKYGSISGSSSGNSCGVAASGSRSPALLATEALIRHDVDRTDTLQGIALKYGCSMEQIRRINRLLPTDTIFLRPFLMIPVEKDSPHYPTDPAAIIRPASLCGLNSRATSSSNSTSTAPPTPVDPGIAEESAISPEEESRKNMEEFLGKIDSSIASTRKHIAESQRNSEFVSSQSDDNIFSSGASMNSSGYYSKPRAYSTASSSSSISSYQQYHYGPSAAAAAASSSTAHHYHKRQSSSGSTASDTSQLIVMTQGKRVQSSLQKLEKQQDELFEL